MSPKDSAPDPMTAERDSVRTDLRNALGVMTGRAQLMQRQIHRSGGMSQADRAQLLHELTTVLAELDRMGALVEDVVTGRASLHRGPVDPFAIPLNAAASAIPGETLPAPATRDQPKGGRRPRLAVCT